MAYSDDIVLFQNRFLANMPNSTFASSSVFINFAQAFLSANADTKTLISLAYPNLYVSTASGPALDLKAADYGVGRYLGAQAQCTNYQFRVATPVTGSNLTIPAGTQVSTVGDNITTIAAYFLTTATATIIVGSTSSNSVGALAIVPGAFANVAANTITVLNTNVNNGALTGANLDAAVGGIDADSDGVLRDKVYAVLAPKYSTTAITNAILAVSGVFDAYVFDPQNGSGQIFYYWCDANITQPGSLATLVAAAVSGVVPPNVTAISSAFTNVSFAVISVQYSAPVAVLESLLQPEVQAAVITYVNSLVHNQAPSSFQMGSAVYAASGGAIVDFQVLGSSPPFAGPSNTVIYHMASTGTVNTTRIYL